MTDWKAAASLYAEMLECRVFPKLPGRKYLREGTREASHVPSVAHWRETDGIGAVLPATGLLVIDCDDAGLAHAFKLSPEDMQATFCTSSRPGRWHLWYRVPANMYPPMRKTGGIDLLTEGVVILPPSEHPDTGKQYVEVGSNDIADASDETLLTIERLLRWHSLSRKCAPILSQGSRNKSMHNSLIHAVREGLLEPGEDHEAVLTAVGLYWNDRYSLKKRLKGAEVWQIVENVLRSKAYAQRPTTHSSVFDLSDYPPPLDVFAMSPAMTEIFDYASAQRVAPWALLGSLLVRASCLIDWRYRIHTGAKTPKPPQLYAVLTANSGDSKTEGMTQARSLMPVPPSAREPYGEFIEVGNKQLQFTPERIPGSAQGVFAVIQGVLRGSKEVSAPNAFTIEADQSKLQSYYQRNYLAQFTEGYDFQQVATRAGSTFMSAVRAMWFSELVGSDIRGETLSIAAEQYLFGLLVSGDWELMHFLLDEESFLRGTAQRFLFFWCTEVEVGERSERPEYDLERYWPTEEWVEKHKLIGPTRMLKVKNAKLVDDFHVWKRAPQESKRSDYWESINHGNHTLMLLLKTAVAVAVIHQRKELRVTKLDLKIAEEVLRESRRVRSGVMRMRQQQYAAQREERREDAKSKAKASREGALDADAEREQRLEEECVLKAQGRTHNQVRGLGCVKELARMRSVSPSKIARDLLT